MKTLTHEDIARVAHGVNRAHCHGIGDLSQPAWKDAPQWQKDSAIAGVQMHAANPNAGPADSHNSWLEQKEKDGWKYGETKDPVAKTHPCFVPYDQLPPEQKAKDYLFCAVVKEMLDIKRRLDAYNAPLAPAPRKREYAGVPTEVIVEQENAKLPLSVADDYMDSAPVAAIPDENGPQGPDGVQSN